MELTLTLLPFYVKQGIIYSKKNAVLILILSLSLALIPTLSMLTNGFIKTVLFEFEGSDGPGQGHIQIRDPDFLDNLYFDEQQMFIADVLNDNGLEYDFLEPRIRVNLYDSFFYSNSTLPTNEILVNEHFRNVSANFARFSPNFELRESDYFNSSAFEDYNEIVEGTYPTSPNEFLINWIIAQKFNLSLNSNFNLTLRVRMNMYEIELDDQYYYTDLNVNFTICGLYLEKSAYEYEEFYTYEDYVENEQYDLYDQDFYKYQFRSSIYSWYNYSLSKSQLYHPVFQLVDSIRNNSILTNKSSPYYYEIDNNLYIYCGFEFQINLDTINLNSMRKESQILMKQYQSINSDLGDDCEFYWDMVYLLPELAMIFNIVRIGISIINLPILIFVISLGILSARVFRKTRIPEFLQLRIKGFTRKMVTRQITIELIINGIIASFLSLVLGLGLFFVLRGEILLILENITYTDMPFEPSAIKPILLWADLLATMIWGFSCSLIMYIPIFYYNRKLSLSDLIAIKDAQDLPVIYDEVTVYDKNVDQVSLNWREFLQLDNTSKEFGEDVSNEGIGIKEADIDLMENNAESKIRKYQKKDKAPNKRVKKRGRKRRAGKTTAIYEDFIKQYEKKIPKIAFLMIIIGLIPILANYFLFYFLDHTPPDYLLDLLQFITGYQPLFMVVVILSPLLIITGLIRFIGIEKPSRFAKLSKFLSTPILGPLNSLFGLKMISSKELIKWIRVFTIFASILISINMISNSVYRYNVVRDNLIIGADIKLEADVDPTSASFPANMLEQTENILANLTNTNNQTYINSIVTCQKMTGKMIIEDLLWIPDTKIDILSVDLSEYLQIIQEDNKILPNPTICENIEDLENYQSLTNSSDLPGVLLSQGFDRYLNPEITTSSTIRFNITYYNYSSSLEFSKVIEFQIIGSLEFPPGLVRSRQEYGWSGDYSYFALLDRAALQEFNCSPIYNSIYQLLDINRNVSPNSTAIIQNITGSIGEILDYNSISLYIQDGEFNSQELLSLLSIIQIIETVLYFLAVVLAVTLGLLLNAIKNSDNRFYSLLYTRGYGKKGSLKILLSQILVMFIIGSVIGTICGFFLPSILIGSIQEQYEYTFYMYYNSRVTFSLPIFWEPVKILLILSGILTVAVGIFFTINYFKKQNLNKSLQQF